MRKKVRVCVETAFRAVLYYRPGPLSAGTAVRCAVGASAGSTACGGGVLCDRESAEWHDARIDHNWGSTLVLKCTTS